MFKLLLTFKEFCNISLSLAFLVFRFFTGDFFVLIVVDIVPEEGKRAAYNFLIASDYCFPGPFFVFFRDVEITDDFLAPKAFFVYFSADLS